MTQPVRLDGVRMRPATLHESSALSPDTVFHFRQEGDVVWADYLGGSIRQGFLAGTCSGARLEFRYVQVGSDGRVDAGQSRCELVPGERGGPRLIERFSWATREGSGTNVFDCCD